MAKAICMRESKYFSTNYGFSPSITGLPMARKACIRKKMADDTSTYEYLRCPSIHL